MCVKKITGHRFRLSYVINLLTRLVIALISLPNFQRKWIQGLMLVGRRVATHTMGLDHCDKRNVQYLVT